MPATCVVGLQWGDEAKGKIVDLLTQQNDFVIRYNGGANAGHTIVRGGQTYKLSLLPTGVLEPRVTSVIANGVVVYPPRFLEELSNLRQAGVAVGSNLLVSNHAHVIFPYHIEEERLQEGAAAHSAIGTTGRGIGPCYQDKVGRLRGVRVGELLQPELLRERLRAIVPYKNRLLQSLSDDARTFDAETLFRDYAAFGEQMRPYVCDTSERLLAGLAEGKNLLFEAAQGSLLDVDHGTYPYVTSSNSSVAGVWSGSGVPTRHLRRVIGIVKAYTTRVGGGPFPTELHDDMGERIRQAGREFGTVTGRPRRCGWLDTVALRYTAALNGVDEIALMLLDVLSVADRISIAVAYECDGQRLERFPADAAQLARCRPIYETLPGWQCDLTQIRSFDDLPLAAQHYVEQVALRVGVRVSFVSVGPDREQTIHVPRS
ncbi:MAG: adenylosuccinate synthase [Gemmataceae bacterium]